MPRFADGFLASAKTRAPLFSAERKLHGHCCPNPANSQVSNSGQTCGAGRFYPAARLRCPHPGNHPTRSQFVSAPSLCSNSVATRRTWHTRSDRTSSRHLSIIRPSAKTPSPVASRTGADLCRLRADFSAPCRGGCSNAAHIIAIDGQRGPFCRVDPDHGHRFVLRPYRPHPAAPRVDDP